jgi:transcriptional regulator with XRE-family HTH domain
MKRMAASLTQQELADDLFVSRQTISNWELGKSYPDIDSLIRLSDQFSISLDDLLKGDIKMVQSLKIGTIWRIFYISYLVVCLLASGVCLLIEYVLDQRFRWSVIVLLACLLVMVVLTILKFAVTHKIVKATLAGTVMLFPLMFAIHRMIPTVSLPQMLEITGVWVVYCWLVLGIWLTKKIRLFYVLALAVLLSIPMEMLTRWLSGTELSLLNFVKYNLSEVVVAIVYAVIGVLRLDKGRLDRVLGPYR